jgi:uncharacterized membrane-anchored protein
VVGPARPVRAGSADPQAATRAVAGRVERGDVVVIDHLDLDQQSAQALLAPGPAAVVNVRRSLSGRQPARGAAMLVAAGIPVVDDAGPALLSQVREGALLRVHEGRVYDGPRLLVEGIELTPDSVRVARDAAREDVDSRLAAVGADSADFLRAHQDLLLEWQGLPEVALSMAGRVVLVVAPGARSATDLAALRSWLREQRPLVVTADSGAGLALAAHLRPRLVVGDIGEARRSRLEGVEEIGPESVPGGLSATDLAVLLATAGDARLVVLTGSPATYEELLDHDRAWSAALLGVRLVAGDRLVDARAVASMHRPAVSRSAVALLVAVGILALVVALLSVPGGDDLLHRLREALPW